MASLADLSALPVPALVLAAPSVVRLGELRQSSLAAAVRAGVRWLAAEALLDGCAETIGASRVTPYSSTSTMVVRSMPDAPPLRRTSTHARSITPCDGPSQTGVEPSSGVGLGRPVSVRSELGPCLLRWNSAMSSSTDIENCAKTVPRSPAPSAPRPVGKRGLTWCFESPGMRLQSPLPGFDSRRRLQMPPWGHRGVSPGCHCSESNEDFADCEVRSGCRCRTPPATRRRAGASRNAASPSSDASGLLADSPPIRGRARSSFAVVSGSTRARCRSNTGRGRTRGGRRTWRRQRAGGSGRDRRRGSLGGPRGSTRSGDGR